MLPEFQLFKGDLLLALPQGADPEPWFQQAFGPCPATFTEGFTTADLTEARALVETLP